MLEINLEYRKGILFVRLDGALTKKTVYILEDEVTTKILKNGLRHVVFNLEQISVIDMKGIHALYYNYELCKRNKGMTYLCGLYNEEIRNKMKKSRILNYMKELDSELSILQVVLN